MPDRLHAARRYTWSRCAGHDPVMIVDERRRSAVKVAAV
jgi:hypothetical protein